MVFLIGLLVAFIFYLYFFIILYFRSTFLCLHSPDFSQPFLHKLIPSPQDSDGLIV